MHNVFEAKGGGGGRRGGGAWDAKYKRTNQKPDGAGSNSPPPPPIYMPCFFDSNRFFSSFAFLAKKKQIKKSQLSPVPLGFSMVGEGRDRGVHFLKFCMPIYASACVCVCVWWTVDLVIFIIGFLVNWLG